MKRLVLFTQIATLVVLLCACGGKNKASSALNGEIIPMKYAENLTLMKGNGYTEAILRNPWDTTAILHTYLLIHKDSIVPEHLPEGTIVRKHEEYSPNLTVSRFTPEGLKFSPTFALVDRYGYRITATNAAGIRQIADKGFQFVPIVAVDSTGHWNELHTKDYVNETPEFNPEKGETEANGMPIISLLARDLGDKKLQKIFIMGSADCISNGEFSKGRNGITSANYQLILQTGLWFSDGKFPVNTNRPQRTDNEFKNVKFTHMIWVRIFFMGIIPAVLALVGTFIYVKRSRK